MGMNIKKAKNIHFIGIGGIGTSAVAQILNEKGKNISGSDTIQSDLTKTLKLKGIKVSIGHNENYITKKHQLVIYSPAIPKTNPELKKAKKIKIKTISYPQALGELSKEYFTIAVAGAHGKSTTTAMIALTLTKAELDPTVVIGTKIREFGNQNFRKGKGKYLVVEACEYRRSFLNINPDILIITNIEAEHLDYYKNLADYVKAFNQLAKKVPKNGKIIANLTDKNIKPALKGVKAKIVKINKDLKLNPKVPGKFNITNAQFAATACEEVGITTKNITKAINDFKGTWRRMEYKKVRLGKTKFIDDYAHHPTEIKTTLTAIREQFPKEKILVIFQPHQYSRTRLLLKDFGKSFSNVDEVIIPNIYRVRDTEKDVKSISPQDLVDEINKHHKNKAKYENSLEKTAQFIKQNHSKYDLIVTMGAGDIDKIYKMI